VKALVKYAQGGGNMEIREVPIPRIGEDEVLIEVKSAGICGTDLHIQEGAFPVDAPVTVGHEFSGVIAQKGGEVTRWSIGERVTSETHAYTCGECYYCRIGRYNQCPHRKGFGYGLDGGFARYVRAKARLLHRLPDNVSFDEAALSSPSADMIHAVICNTDIEPLSGVAVIGPGPMGLIGVQLAKLRKAAKIFAIGRSPMRLEKAAELGADITINPSDENPVERILKETSGEGVDVVLECSGSEAGAQQAVEMVRRLGQITLVGIQSGQVPLDLNRILFKEATVKGSASNTWIDWERALKLMSRRELRSDLLITHRLPLGDWEEGFRLARERKAIKVILHPED
jgi:L-iditol 2-dehydrogenase